MLLYNKNYLKYNNITNCNIFAIILFLKGKIMKNIFTIFIITLFTLSISYLTNNSYKLSKDYEKTYIKYANTKTLDNNVKKEVNNIINSFVSLLTNTKKTITNKNNINYIQKLNNIKMQIQTNTIYILILLFLTMILYFSLNKMIILSFLYIQSMIFLIYGLLSPIFLMYVIQDFGSSFIILQFESNSIISSIEKLFNQNNYFVGGIILIFSIIFPIMKTLISFLALYIKNNNILLKFSTISSSLSKLSMTDVFVLSIFLVYLSPKSDGIIKTELEIGFIYFFLYVTISLFIALLNKSDK